MSLVRRVQRLVHNGYVVKFFVVGVASFIIDLGLLAILHEGFDVDLWIATPIAFLTSLVFNFFVQRTFTFQSDTRAHVSFLKYGALVAFNVIATDVIVNVIAGTGLSYAIGKVIATVATTGWNFLLYKHWIFKADRPVTHEGIDINASGTAAPRSVPED